MQKHPALRLIAAGIYSLIFGFFVTSMFFPRSGELVLLREIAISAFLLSSAMLLICIAIPCWKGKRYLALAGIAVCFVVFVWVGSNQSAKAVRDIRYGQQTITISNCSLLPIDNCRFYLVPKYALQGYSPSGTQFTFPISENEYKVLRQQMDGLDEEWEAQVVAYIYCERLVSFTVRRTEVPVHTCR